MIVFCEGILIHSRIAILHDNLNSLSQCETDWGMKLNVAKCH